MSKSNDHENKYLKLIFQNQAIPNIGDASGIQPSATEGSLYVGLFTSDPGETNSGAEATYTNYARIAMARNATVWDVTNNIASNVAQQLWPTSGGGAADVITHFGVFTAVTGGDLIGSGALTGSVTINNGDTPKANAGQMQITED